MADILITAENVSKKFCKSLKRSMLYGITDISMNMIGLSQKTEILRYNEFWSVNDVSFVLERGDCLGLIGPNGAGKSTLLKILNGIIYPDKGRASIKGKSGALIEIGAGFHPMLTGRENIYINGAILGLRKKEIDRKFEDIVEFAELDEFIDTPVKHYSSGMYVRLGFAIAAQLEPDVFLIDEVLAVGDFKFKQKCAGRINEIKNNAAVVFVSHAMRDITMLCTKVIVLNKGRAVFFGQPEEAVEYYLRMMDTREEELFKSSKAGNSTVEAIHGEMYHNHERIQYVRHEWVNSLGEPCFMVKHGSEIVLQFSFKLVKPANNIIIGVPIWDHNGNLITGIASDMKNILINARNDGFVEGHLKINNIILNPNMYDSVFVVHDGRETLYRCMIGSFRVREMPSYWGPVTPEHSWHFKN